MSRPGRNTTPPRPVTTLTLLTTLTDWVADGQLSLADLGYEGDTDLLRIPVKKPGGGNLPVDQQTYNAVHGALRYLGERANSLLKTTFKSTPPLARPPLADRPDRRRSPGRPSELPP